MRPYYNGRPSLLPLTYDDKRRRRNRLPRLDISRLHQVGIRRYGRRRGSFLVVLAYIVIILGALYFFGLVPKFSTHEIPSWPSPSSTLIYRKDDLRRIFQWEIISGHYPSKNIIPPQLGLTPITPNPALPPCADTLCAYGVGPARTYLDIAATPPDVSYPPRPVPGSAVDLDIVFEKCDFSAQKYVRDCLEFLRIGAGLDNGNRVRRDVSPYQYIFINNGTSTPFYSSTIATPIDRTTQVEHEQEFIMKNNNSNWEISPISLPPTSPPPAQSVCDPKDPRIFHMYWTGPFTDKTYLAVTSFLYTQNLGLNLAPGANDLLFCPPKLTLWIMPESISLEPPASAEVEMMEHLRLNKWSSPFLHPRFADIIEFKVWNLTEQFDSLPELRAEWRHSSFTSGGYSMDFQDIIDNPDSSARDGLMVKMSDVVRFVVCHRYGGIYIDADTIFLRDWEEMWGWKGAYAYRWSYHPKYNTAVIRLRKGSALGSFILRTALRNDLDFHPMTLSEYLKDARLEPLLYRLPDALFDPAWLNMEGYQQERPPQPHFDKFGEFFETPTVNSATPQLVGFEGFFRGAFSYHFHNSWQRLVDASHNIPDLGSRFSANATEYTLTRFPDHRDLDWSAVLKRTFEAYLRGERPNMYGEWIRWE